MDTATAYIIAIAVVSLGGASLTCFTLWLHHNAEPDSGESSAQ